MMLNLVSYEKCLRLFTYWSFCVEYYFTFPFNMANRFYAQYLRTELFRLFNVNVFIYIWKHISLNNLISSL